jgi:hypothetical protein
MPETLYLRPVSEPKTCKTCGQDVAPEWGVFDDPDAKKPVHGPFAARGEAKQAALDNRTNEAVVQLRADGSVYGEVRPGVVSSEPGQTVEGGTAADGGK